MPTVLLVDDRRDYRETIVLNLKMYLGAGWVVRDNPPLDQLSAYPSWIGDEDAAVLILDERLGEQKSDSGIHVAYSGHLVVEFLRRSMPTFPIFVLTSYPEDEELVERFGSVEEIIPRGEFGEHPEGYVDRIKRSGQRFLEVHERELSELAELSARMATGRANPSDRKRIAALHHLLSLPYSGLGGDLAEWLSGMEGLVEGLEAIVEQLQRENTGEVETDS